MIGRKLEYRYFFALRSLTMLGHLKKNFRKVVLRSVRIFIPEGLYA